MSAAELSLEDLQDVVLEKLQLLDIAQLGEVCVQLGITVPPVKMGKKTATRSFVLNHLTSDAVEENEHVDEIFKDLHQKLVVMVGSRSDDVLEEKADKNVVVCTDEVVKSVRVAKIQKLTRIRTTLLRLL